MTLKRRTPLRRKRATPRRNEGRVQHKRAKPKAKAPPDAAEQRHLDRVANGPCIVCGKTDDIVLHHVMKAPNKKRRRDHRFVARLCAGHHNMSNVSVHALGSEAKFLAHTGVDVVAWAIEQWAISQSMEKN